MTVPSRGRRHLGHRVVGVCGAPESVDIRDVLGQRQVAHARLAIGILYPRVSGSAYAESGISDSSHNRQRISLVVQIRAAQQCQGPAEAVAGNHERVAWVGLLGGVDLALQRSSDGLVVAPEPGVDLAAAAQGAGLHGSVEVGEPIAEGAAAPEGQHNQLVGVVGGQEAGRIAKRIYTGAASERMISAPWGTEQGFHLLVEFIQHRSARRLHVRAVPRGTGNSRVGAVRVLRAIRRSRPLGIQIQLVEHGGRHI